MVVLCFGFMPLLLAVRHEDSTLHDIGQMDVWGLAPADLLPLGKDDLSKEWNRQLMPTKCKQTDIEQIADKLAEQNAVLSATQIVEQALVRDSEVICWPLNVTTEIEQSTMFTAALMRKTYLPPYTMYNSSTNQYNVHAWIISWDKHPKTSTFWISTIVPSASIVAILQKQTQQNLCCYPLFWYTNTDTHKTLAS